MTKSQRILFLTLKTFSFTGGIEKACRSLIYALQQSIGVDLSTYSMYDDTSDADHRYLANSHFKGFGNQKIKFALKILGAAFKFDQVVLSHINLLLFAKVIKTIKPSTKIILWAHGIEVWRAIPQWKKKFLQEKAEVWAVSSYTKQQLMERHQIPSKNIKVLNNTIDPFYQLPADFSKPEQLLQRYQIKSNNFVLFTLTRLSATEHLKNYDLVIESLHQLQTKQPNLVYVIGGKADEREKTRLEALIKTKDLQDHVKLIGFIDENELTEHYLLADVFVLPSKKEGFGIVLIEAAACGCQLIGGNVDGSTDALLNGELGQMINPDDINDIEKAIEKAIGDKEHQQKQQQELSLGHFGFDKYKERINKLINKHY